MTNVPLDWIVAVAAAFVDTWESLNDGVNTATPIENLMLPGLAMLAPAPETIPGTAKVSESANTAIDAIARRLEELRPDIAP